MYKVLYISLVCPWAQRAKLVRTLKGLRDIIQLVVLDYELFPEGWWVIQRAFTLIFLQVRS